MRPPRTPLRPPARALLPWMLLLIGSLLTIAAGRYVTITEANRRLLRFERISGEVSARIGERRESYDLLVRGLQGLFRSSGTVSPEDFHAYVESLDLPTTYPGVQSVGATGPVADHGDSATTVGGGHTPPINYAPTELALIEPPSPDSRAFIGFDIAYEPGRLDALVHAARSGQPVISAAVHLLQPRPAGSTGFLIVQAIPDRSAGSPPRGYVFASIRPDLLIQSVFGVAGYPFARFRLHDGESLSQDNVVFDNTNHSVAVPDLRVTRTIEAGGRTWTLEIRPTAEFVALNTSYLPAAVWTGGTIFTGAMFLSSRAQTRGRRLAEQARESLRESEAEFRAIFELSGVGQSQTDPRTGRFLRVNQRLCDLIGVGADALLAKTIFDITHPEDHARERGLMTQALSSDRPEYTLEKRYLRPDGAAAWVQVTRTLVRDAAGRPTRTAAVVQDITARKLAEEEVQRVHASLEALVRDRTAELREAVAQLEGFTHSVSHDLRAPLRSMWGFAHALLEDYAPVLDETGRDYAERIVAASRRMDRLITDLLDYSRLARSQLRAGPVDLESAAAEAAAQVDGPLAAANAVIDIARPLPVVLGHRRVLVQTLANLLENAVKFVEPGVRPRVTLRARTSDGTARIEVEDNGIGIDARFRERIFRPFERLHSDETYEGTGIGLAIAKTGIERMGGAIGVVDAAAGGSRFWIELPLAETPT